MSTFSSAISISYLFLSRISMIYYTLLLKDRSSGKNIIWATNNYSRYGANYAHDYHMKIEQIIIYYGNIIKPHTKKHNVSKKKRLHSINDTIVKNMILL